MDVSLHLYTVQIREKRGAYVNLDNFDGHGTSLSKLFKVALGHYDKPGKKYDLEQMVELDLLDENKHRLDGVVKIGRFGTAGDIKDTTDGSVAFNKGRQHAPMEPFFFRLVCPAGQKKALLVCQARGGVGIKTLLQDIVTSEFIRFRPTHTLLFQGLAPDYMIGQLLSKGRPRSVTFVKRTIPADKADVVSGKSVEQAGRIEVSYHSKSAEFFRPLALQASLTSVGGVASVYQFNDFEPDQIKVRVDVGGKTRTLNLNAKGSLRASFDISDKVVEDTAGYPNIKDVKLAAQDLIAEIAPAAGVKL